MIDPDKIHSILDFETLRGEIDYRAIHPEDRPEISDLALAEIVADTPDRFRAFAHYALLWGISDDCYRVDLVKDASDDLRSNLRWVGRQIEHGDDLDTWLAGPEAIGPECTKAYVAFTCLRMAADDAS